MSLNLQSKSHLVCSFYQTISWTQTATSEQFCEFKPLLNPQETSLEFLEFEFPHMKYVTEVYPINPTDILRASQPLKAPKISKEGSYLII